MAVDISCLNQMNDPSFCAAQAGVFDCVSACVPGCGPPPTVDCGFFSCWQVDPNGNVINPLTGGSGYTDCLQKCQTGCNSRPSPNAPTDGQQCLGPTGVVACTVTGIAKDLSTGGQIIGGAVQAATRNATVILLVLAGVVGLVLLRDVRAL